MSKVLVLLIVIASLPAHAGTPVARIGATVGLQRTDRNAWVFGPSLEITITDELSIRGEGQIELGDIDDPFGESNLLSGTGPHVNHALFGPTWRPVRFAAFAFAVGAVAGAHIMHSVFADDEYTKGPAAGLFVQAGRTLGPVSIALQLRLDVSPSVERGNPDGTDAPSTSGRINLAFEIPIHVR
jgi:hypothetical protein